MSILSYLFDKLTGNSDEERKKKLLESQRTQSSPQPTAGPAPQAQPQRTPIFQESSFDKKKTQPSQPIANEEPTFMQAGIKRVKDSIAQDPEQYNLFSTMAKSSFAPVRVAGQVLDSTTKSFAKLPAMLGEGLGTAFGTIANKSAYDEQAQKTKQLSDTLYELSRKALASGDTERAKKLSEEAQKNGDEAANVYKQLGQTGVDSAKKIAVGGAGTVATLAGANAINPGKIAVGSLLGGGLKTAIGTYQRKQIDDAIAAGDLERAQKLSEETQPSQGPLTDFATGAGDMAGQLPAVEGVIGATAPIASKVLKPIAGKFTGRIAAGGANVAQGVAINAATGNPTTPLSAGLDFVTGLVGGKTQFEHPNAKANLVDEVNQDKPRNIEIKRASNLSEEGMKVQENFAKKIEENPDAMIEEYTKRFGKELNTDNARELSPDYSKNNDSRSQFSPAVHEPASALVKEIYKRQLQVPDPKGENIVLFTAGGTGSGKTSGIHDIPELTNIQDEAQIVYDTNLNNFSSAKEKIDMALAAGKRIVLAYVHRDPVDAFENGALPRAMRQGRTVPVGTHIETHVGAPSTLLQLAQEYKDNPNVDINVVNNSLGRGKAVLSNLDLVKGLNYNAGELNTTLLQKLDEQLANGKISQAVYDGTRQNSPQRDITPNTGGILNQSQLDGLPAVKDTTHPELQAKGQQIAGEVKTNINENVLRDTPAPQDIPPTLDRTQLSGAALNKSSAEILAAREKAATPEIPPVDEIKPSSTLNINPETGKIEKTSAPNKFEYDLKSLNTPEGVKQAILSSAQTAQDNGTLQTQRRGTMTEQQIHTMADQLGMSAEEVAKRKPGKIWNAEQADAANRIMLKTNEDLVAIGTKIREYTDKGLDVPESLRLAQMEAATRSVGVMASVIGDRSEAARALRAAQMFKNALDDPTNQQKLKEEATRMFAGDPKRAAEVMAKLAEFEPTDTLGQMKFLRQVKPHTPIDMIEEFWYNSVLSNTATHIVNTTSNLISALIRVPEKAISGAIDAGVSGLTGKERTRYVSEAGAELNGMKSGFAKGFQRALLIMKTGISEEDLAKGELGKGQAIKGPVGDFINIPTKALSAADQIFRSVNYEMDIWANANRIARQQGKTGEELVQTMADLVANPTGQMMESAKEGAKYRIFQSDSKSADAVKYFRDNLATLDLGKFGKLRPVRFIIPFVQTPINVFKYGLERTPAGFLSAGASALQGADKGEVSDRIARAVIGSMVMVPLATYFMDGKITGAAPTDKKLKDAFYAEGKLPWSVKVGNNWVSYNRVEPLNSMLSQMAIWHDAFEKNGKEVSVATISEFLRQTTRNFADQTFMTGLGNLMNAVEDPERFGQKFITDIAGGFIPSIVAAGARATDNTVRQPKTIKEAFAQRLPIATQTVTPQESAFEPGGNAVRHTNEGLARNIASNFIGLRTSPDTGVNIMGDLEAIQKLRKNNTDQTKTEDDLADSIFQQLKDLPQEEGQKLIETNLQNGTLTKSVMSKVEDRIKTEAMGLPEQELTIKSAPIKVRAQFMDKKLKELNSAEQDAWLQKMIQDKVITNDVMDEYVKLQGGGNLPLIAK